MPTLNREKFSSQASPDVLAAFASSLEEFDSLYRDLAK